MQGKSQDDVDIREEGLHLGMKVSISILIWKTFDHNTYPFNPITRALRECVNGYMRCRVIKS